MKRCESCGNQEGDGAGVCSRCHASVFVPMSIGPSTPRSQSTRILPCLSCGQLNQLPSGVSAGNRVVLCGRCRVPLKELSTTLVQPAVDLAQFPRVTLGIYLAGLLAVAGTVVWGFNSERQLEGTLAEKSQQEENRHREALKLEEEQRTRRHEEEALAVQAGFKDPKFLSGELAAENHLAEWGKRILLDPAYAWTPIEQRLLKMQRLGADSSIVSQKALEEVALLSAPPGSRVEVESVGDKFIVRVAFKLSATTTHESGGYTKHSSPEALRREVEQICARLARDLFEYCGDRGIRRLHLSCNKALHRTSIPQNATAAERAELLDKAPLRMKSIYRAIVDDPGIPVFSQWRSASLSKIISLFRVEKDAMRELTISKGDHGESASEDPEGPLEF